MFHQNLLMQDWVFKLGTRHRPPPARHFTHFSLNIFFFHCGTIWFASDLNKVKSNKLLRRHHFKIPTLHSAIILSWMQSNLINCYTSFKSRLLRFHDLYKNVIFCSHAMINLFAGFFISRPFWWESSVSITKFES